MRRSAVRIRYAPLFRKPSEGAWYGLDRYEHIDDQAGRLGILRHRWFPSSGNWSVLSVPACKRQGRTLVYSWNPKSRLAGRLRDLVGVIYEGMSPQAKEALYPERRL